MGNVTLNVDGSALTNPGDSGYGGLVRDHEGKFILGFYGSIGVSNNIHAEIMALLKGLEICWARGFTHVRCE
uniref:14.7 kDa ribonuclease H-like protein n=1 Tax=Cajanus cajan TaxID=3821 RepID=A0A151RP16_CAJCA|nr:14.7 kDa ribonuclease H-like protein [Cajanus cajan]